MDVGVEGDRLYLTSDKNTLADLSYAIEALFRLAKIMKMRAATARGELERIKREKTEKEKELETAMEAFRAARDAEKVYLRYEAYLATGKCKYEIEAVELAARDLGLGVRETKQKIRQHQEAIARIVKQKDEDRIVINDRVGPGAARRKER